MKVLGEQVYVDLDDETGCWCLFGTETGHAYASFADREEAEAYCKQNFPD